MENKHYLKAVEALGELLNQKDQTIKLNEYDIKHKEKRIAELIAEVERLELKIANIEKYIEHYSENVANS